MSTVLSDLPTLSATNAGSSAQTSASVTNTASVSTATQSTSQSGSSSLPNLSSGSSATTSSVSSASVITGAPTLTSGSISQLSDLPTLSGFYSYPAPTVPPTAGAPYMQAVDLPQNFVFIVVGAVIAFFALCIISWRFLAAWQINRNIKRDGTAIYTPLYDTKKKPAKVEQGHDMADLSALPKSFGSSAPSLFFSPTAEVARQSIGRPLTQSHHQHMPSGHYRDVSG